MYSLTSPKLGTLDRNVGFGLILLSYRIAVTFVSSSLR